mgnify:CR=1 FL=1
MEPRQRHERRWPRARFAEIADVLGIRQASLYYYFPSKEVALETVCLIGAEGFYERAKAIAESEGVTDIDTWWQGSFGASLDHTVWFHRPVRMDQWHLFDFSCHRYIGARGVSVGHVFSTDGDHVATVTQEVLIRRRSA